MASRNCRAPDWATPRSMMRVTFLGSASSAARALLTASVSGSERYSTPSGDRYCSDGTPVWRASSASPRKAAEPMVNVNATRRMSLSRMGPDSMRSLSPLGGLVRHTSGVTFHDIRLAVRRLALDRSVAAIVVLCLALGIGVNATLFSVVDGVLVQPLPFTEP